MGFFFLCATRPLPVTVNEMEPSSPEAPVLSPVLCAAASSHQRGVEVSFYEYQCRFCKSDLNIAACFPGRPCSRILAAAKAAPYAPASAAISQRPPRGSFLFCIWLAQGSKRKACRAERVEGRTAADVCLPRVEMCCSGVSVKLYVLRRLGTALSSLIHCGCQPSFEQGPDLQRSLTT